MADTTAPAPTRTVWDFLTSDGVSKCLVILATCVASVIGTLVTQMVIAKPTPILAADPPRPSPLATIADLDNSLNVHGAAIKTEIVLAVRALLDERFGKKAGGR